MYQKILVPTDGSEVARRALDEAVRLAAIHGSSIRVMHVLDALPVIAPGGGAPTFDLVIDELRTEGQRILKEAARAVQQAGVPVDTVLIEVLGGPAGEQIVRTADSWPAQLIVCGTHGRRGMRRMVMGSDAEYVVRHTSIPVLLLRSEER
jgi:nucleotide-binding universal stress UspA family protein